MTVPLGLGEWSGRPRHPRQRRGTAAINQSIAELTTEQFDWTFKSNVYAVFWIIKAAMPHLEPSASIINTAL